MSNFPPALSIRDQVRNGAAVRPIVETALSRAKSMGSELNAFLTLCEEKALRQADQFASDSNLRTQPLAGVPIAIKDNICYSDYPCTCGSKILEGYIPPYDATIVTRLIAAGALIVGKTNLDEFAMGSSNENSAFGPVINPVRRDLAPGGSSGGSAVTVSAGIVPLSLGSETGGSVRQPASFCGIYGLKPTYGAVSRYGLIAFASSTDQISPFARNVADLATLFGVIAGHDPMDSTSSTTNYPDFESQLNIPRTFRIGVPKEYFAEGLDSEVEREVRRCLDQLKSLGHTIVDISLPTTGMAIPIYYIVASAEASANLARFDGVRYGLRVGGEQPLMEMYTQTRAAGFGREVKRRIMLGTHVLSSGYYDAYYTKASKVRELLSREYVAALKSVDLIVSPTCPTAAFKLGEKVADPLAMYLSDVYTAPASLVGIPAISIPYGKVNDGRPVGVQFQAKHFDELSLFQIARQLELK